MRRLCLILILTVTAASAAGVSPPSTVTGTVRDATGGTVADAQVSVVLPAEVPVRSVRSDAEGRFRLADLPHGTYVLIVSATGFAERRVRIAVGDTAMRSVDVILDVHGMEAHITVTASRDVVEDITRSVQAVNVIDAAAIGMRAKAVLAQIAQEEPGVQLQRTSPTIGGIFVRGLTGNKVSVFMDGVRYSTSAQRGGINTFLNLFDPSMLQGVEILRGPNSAQYGSDAMGGSVQLLSRLPRLSPDGARTTDGSLVVTMNSADRSAGASASGTVGFARAALLAELSGRRVNALRPGRGQDSHAAVTRFFGLSSSLFGGARLADTGFTQYGGMTKLLWAPSERTQLVAHYSRGQQDGGRRYDQLLGGDGNLIADLRNLMGDFAYLRSERTGFGWFDRLSSALSLNSQREERVNQGGAGNPRAVINHDYERTTAVGAQTTALKQWGTRQLLSVGADLQRETIAAPAFGVHPVTGVATVRRGRVPDDSRYLSGGTYVQHTWESHSGRVRLTGSGRGSLARYRSRASRSPLVDGTPLWPDDRLSSLNATFRAGAVFVPVERFSMSAAFSRGYRAPHITDLGGLGLTGSGFEVAAPDLAGLGATIGTTADRNAVSTGRAVDQVRSEKSVNLDVAAHYRASRVTADVWLFSNRLGDLIEKVSLLLPSGAVGRSLGGQPIVSQLPSGVVFVGAAGSPVLVRTNLPGARIQGFEQAVTARVGSSWSLRQGFSYVHAHESGTGRPPNIEGGTPAPAGFLTVRYATRDGRWWIEPYVHAAGRQRRLSTLDLEDRRTGAARSRSSIESFFTNGARARGWVVNGPDGVAGTADDRLAVTGETLAQIQDRVLGGGVNAARLFTAVPGYVTVNVRGGARLGTRHQVRVDFENLTDRNYRGISWGVDAPGRGLSVSYRLTY